VLACAALIPFASPAAAQDQDLGFLGRYTLEPDCGGEPVRLQPDRFVVADLVCAVEDIDSEANGTFELSLSGCTQGGTPSKGNSVFGYQIDGNAVALSFWGPIIPVFRCDR
jgi:hypothetical protein